MNFKEVALVFDEIEKESSRTLITEKLAYLFQNASSKEAMHLAYLCLGELNPPYIGTQFGVAKKNMVKIIARLINQPELLVQDLVTQAGDSGSVVMHYSWPINQSLTVLEVYTLLNDFEKLEGIGSQEQKIEFLYQCLLRLEPVCAKYVIRIVMGTLRLGFSDMTMMDAFSWMATGDKSLKKYLEDAYNVCADVGLIIQTLKEQGIDAIKAMNIHVGIPIRPAAAERLPEAQAIIDKIGTCVAQPKIDGFRVQVHVDNRNGEQIIRFFSRNLLDMSAMFPELVQVCKTLPVTSLILDGEAMVYDPNTDQFMPFQETVKRRRKHEIDEVAAELPLTLHVFDLLYLNGQSCLDKAHSVRRQLAKDLLDTVNSKSIKLIDEIKVTTAQDLLSYFDQEIAAGLEGVVVKRPEAHYQPGKRNFNWIKLKYQASQKLEDTLDVVILGYYAGQGKRAQFGIGALLVGCYDAEYDCFETVAKIGTGFFDLEWIEVKKRCDEIKVSEKPHNVVCDKSLTPSVWVDPTIVCEVLADEITISPVHSAGKAKGAHFGLALRFPRFIKYRPDKSAYQTTSVKELKEIQKVQTV